MACSFRKEWMENSEFSWIREVPNAPNMAFCVLCKGKFSLSNMGFTAVKSHKRGKKHQQKEKISLTSLSLNNMFGKKAPEDISENRAALAQSSNNSKTVSFIEIEKQNKTVFPGSKGIQNYFLKDNVLRSEILWCLQTVMTHKSLRSAEKDSKIFQTLFPDSEIAKSIQLGKDKISYIIVYGLHPYFKVSLIEELQMCEHFVIGFDESLNKISQKQQMDFNIRYWCCKSNEVKTRYLNSAFLGRSRALDLVESFIEATKPLNLKKLFQLSMDGPNVNQKFFKELSCMIKESDDDAEVLNIGSCGLHALNGAFKTGVQATGWNIMEFHRAIYYLFKDSPARRALFSGYTNSKLFPRKFCFIRWVENASVAERSMQLIPLIKLFVEGVEKDKVAPTSKSYKEVKAAIGDSLLPAKLAFFQLVAIEIEGFLREYQTDAPLIPFLHGDLSNLCLRLMQRFLKRDALNIGIMDVDLEEKSNYLPSKQIDIGFCAQSSLKKAKVSDLQAIEFKIDCRTLLINCLMKLRIRSPLIYKLTKSVFCLDPKVATNEAKFLARLTSLLIILSDKKWISCASAEKAKIQLKQICSRPENISKLKSYRKSEQRIDSFWYELISSEENATEAMAVIKMVMILSHGNANVERGFSLNKDCLEQNIAEETIVARRMVYDSVLSNGGTNKIEITKQMVLNVKNARSRYGEAAEKKRKENQEKAAEVKRKRDAEVEMKKLNEKRMKILEAAQRESEKIEDEIAAIKMLQTSSKTTI